MLIIRPQVPQSRRLRIDIVVDGMGEVRHLANSIREAFDWCYLQDDQDIWIEVAPGLRFKLLDANSRPPWIDRTK